MTHDFIYSDSYAEALYYFVGHEDIYPHFCEVSFLEDLSMAEFVDKYHFNEFKQYLFDSGFISFEELDSE